MTHLVTLDNGSRQWCDCDGMSASNPSHQPARHECVEADGNGVCPVCHTIPAWLPT